jgi:cold shock CspA family protein
VETGTVKWFNAERKHGFIKRDCGGPNVLVNLQAVKAVGLTDLQSGQRVAFEVEHDDSLSWHYTKSLAALAPAASSGRTRTICDLAEAKPATSNPIGAIGALAALVPFLLWSAISDLRDS